MKIALFTDTWHPQVNGVVAYLDSVLPRLAEGNEVMLFAPGNVKKIEFSSAKCGNNARICLVPASPFPYYEGYRMTGVVLHELSGILKKEKPDVVHAHAPVLLGLQGLLAAKQRGIPVVATYHTHFPDYLPYLLDGKFPGIFHALGKKTAKGLIRFVFSLAEKPAAPTEELAKELRRYGVKHVVVLPNGIDIGRLRAEVGAAARFKEKHHVPEGRKVILYVGRLGLEKRLGVLLEALTMVKTKDWCLLVVGSGPYHESYMAQAKALGLKNTIFTGYVDADLLGAAYSCGDVFVSPSDSETFGLTFIEAMALGVPAIGVDRLGPKGIIENGKNGFLVRPGDSRAIAEKIDLILSDPALRERMGIEARKTAERFSIEESARKTLEVYEELVEKRRKR